MSNLLAERIADGMLRIGEAVDVYLNAIKDDSPIAGSLAERERKSKYGSEKLFGVKLATDLIWITIGVPSDNMRSAYRLMRSSAIGGVAVHRYAIFAVLRVTLEVSALVSWLADPKIDSRTRLVRALTLAEYSRSQRENAELMREHPNYLDSLVVLREEIKRSADHYNLQKIKARLATEDGTVEIPKAIQLVGRQFDALANTHAGDAMSMYAMLSEYSHGNIFATLTGFTPEQRSMTPNVAIGHIAVAANYASAALAHAMLDFIELMGWDKDRWHELADDALDDLRIAAEVAKQRV